MTEAIQLAEQRNRLGGALRVLAAVNNEAMVCATNHAYYQIGRGSRNKSRAPMLLLDFDQIAATLRPAIQVQVQEPENVFEIPTDASQIGGPHTMRFALQQLDSYALPPGAMVELLRRRTLLRQGLSDRGNSVLKTVTRALETSTPVTSLDESGVIKTLEDTLVHELREFRGIYDDVDLLEDVLRRATPFDDLVGTRPKESDPVFAETNRILSVRRPRKESANELDALNVAFVVWMFLSPKEGSRRQVPLLISDTQAMKDFKDMQSRFSLPQASDLQVFNRRRFLLLDSQISKYTGGRDDLMVVKATRLAHETQQLHAHVMLAITTLSALEDGDRLVRLELDRLDSQFANYRAIWGRLLEPLWRYPELDRVSHLNATWMPRVEQAIRGLEPNLGAAQLRDRLSNIRNAFAEAVDTDRKVQLTLTGAGTIADVVGEEGGAAPLFERSVVVGSSAKTLLSELTPGVPVREFTQSILDTEHPLRIVVTGSPYFRRGEAIFTADVAQEAARIRVTVVWTHNEPLRQLAQEIGSCGNWLCRNDSERFELVAFCKSGEVRAPLGLAELPDTLTAAIARLNDPELFELRGETTAAFADVEPLVGVERQIGVAAPLDWWTERTIGAVNELMFRTCHGGIPRKNARRALNDVLRFVSERTQRAAA